jgi:hypothetical protein
MKIRLFSTLGCLLFSTTLIALNSTAANANNYQANTNVINNTGITIKPASLTYIPSVFPNDTQLVNWSSIQSNAVTSTTIIHYKTGFVGSPVATRWKMNFKFANDPRTCSIDAIHPLGAADAMKSVLVRILPNGSARITSAAHLTNTTYTCQ